MRTNRITRSVPSPMYMVGSSFRTKWHARPAREVVNRSASRVAVGHGLDTGACSRSPWLVSAFACRATRVRSNAPGRVPTLPAESNTMRVYNSVLTRPYPVLRAANPQAEHRVYRRPRTRRSREAALDPGFFALFRGLVGDAGNVSGNRRNRHVVRAGVQRRVARCHRRIR